MAHKRTHIPNEASYRPLLGIEYNRALFILTKEANDASLDSNLGANDILRKWIKRAWDIAHPGEPLPPTKPYHTDLDLYNPVNT
jgi:hypothetical protein